MEGHVNQGADLAGISGYEDVEANFPSQEKPPSEASHQLSIHEIDVKAENEATTLNFKDGKRRIDFIISYKPDNDDSKKIKTRKKFEDGLQEAGLELELEPKEESQDGTTCFLKVHAPWPALINQAEIMHIKRPLKDQGTGELEEFDGYNICRRKCRTCLGALKCFCNPCEIDSPYEFTSHNAESAKEREAFENGRPGDDGCCNEPNECCCCYPCCNAFKQEKKPKRPYRAEFTVEKAAYFDIEDEETFFSNAERSRITGRILSVAKFGKHKMDFGIERLIKLGVYESAFPLHEGTYETNTAEESNGPSDINMRSWLYKEWALFGKWCKFQPLETVRLYYGDKIAMYFGFLGFYTTMLVLPALMGLGVVAYGAALLLLDSSTPRNDICYDNGTVMCPLEYQTCRYWNLSDSCTEATVTSIFDNNATIVFAMFMSIWVTLFLEFWKRKQFKLSCDWGVVDYDEERDVIRPDYEVLVKTTRLNPATLQREPYLEEGEKYKRIAFSAVTVLFWILLIITAVISIIVYRLAMIVVMEGLVANVEDDYLRQYLTSSTLTTYTATIISLIIIMILNKVYYYVAVWLTNWELPRTQNDFEDNFIFKMFCFRCVNFFAKPFYTAFVKVSLTNPPDRREKIGPWEMEQCGVGGCMYALSSVLMIYMIVRMLWGNLRELGIPWIKNKYRRSKSIKESLRNPENAYTRWERDYDLESFENLALFDEYMEIVLQFSFVTLFVCAFPLAPLLALIQNLIAIRLDAKKFTCERRRPVAQKCSNIGAWYTVLEFLSGLAVITNAFTIAFTSDAVPRFIYEYFDPGNRNLMNYVDSSLSVFNVSNFENDCKTATKETTCRYRGYRNSPFAEEPYNYSEQYWQIFVGRLAFIIIMEHAVFFLKRLFDYLIPDKSRMLQDRIKREHYLVKNMMAKGKDNPMISVMEQDEMSTYADIAPGGSINIDAQMTSQV